MWILVNFHDQHNNKSIDEFDWKSESRNFCQHLDLMIIYYRSGHMLPNIGALYMCKF